MSHLFGGSGFLGLGHGGWANAVEDIGVIAAGVFGGPALAAAAGAGAGALQHPDNRLQGALIGGAAAGLGSLGGQALGGGASELFGDALSSGVASGAEQGVWDSAAAGTAANAATAGSGAAPLGGWGLASTGFDSGAFDSVLGGATGGGGDFGAGGIGGGAGDLAGGGAGDAGAGLAGGGATGTGAASGGAGDGLGGTLVSGGEGAPAPAVAATGQSASPLGGATSGTGGNGSIFDSTLEGATKSAGAAGDPLGSGTTLSPIDASAVQSQTALVPPGENNVGLAAGADLRNIPPAPGSLAATADGGPGSLAATGGGTTDIGGDLGSTLSGAQPPGAAAAATAGMPTPPIPPAAGAQTLGLQGGEASLGGGAVSPNSLVGQLAASAGGTGTTSGPAGWLNNTIGTDFFTNTGLLQGGLAAATLGYDAMRGNQPVKGYNATADNALLYSQQAKATNAQADKVAAQAAQLQTYLTNGTLPPGVATALDQASKAATATIRSQYASRGMSGSSAEAADLANVRNTITAQGVSIATKLLDSGTGLLSASNQIRAQGLNTANLSSQLYNTIMSQQLASDKSLGDALGSLASASARPTVTLKAA